MPSLHWKYPVVVGPLLLFAVACQDAPLAPYPLGRVGAPLFSNAGGNADAAHQCQRGGFQNLFRTDGTGFTNAGDCVRYAAQGGTLARRLTAYFTNVSLAACNEVSWGVEIDGALNPLGGKLYDCTTVPSRDTSITYLSTQTARVYLRDGTCYGWTHFEDGNHAAVIGTTPADIEISDAGGYCESPPGYPRAPGQEGGSLNVTRTITGF
jgi:hypothetical protein